MKSAPKDLIRARGYASRLLSYRERSVKEMADRLARKGFSDGVRAKVVSDLERQGLVNDHRFAVNFANSRLSHKPSGLPLIISELSSKGIGREVIDSVIEEIAKDYDEYETACRIAAVRVDKNRSIDTLKAKRRLYDHLLRRRFRKDIIHRVLARFFNE